jgi:hypothetical protein
VFRGVRALWTARLSLVNRRPSGGKCPERPEDRQRPVRLGFRFELRIVGRENLRPLPSNAAVQPVDVMAHLFVAFGTPLSGLVATRVQSGHAPLGPFGSFAGPGFAPP